MMCAVKLISHLWPPLDPRRIFKLLRLDRHGPLVLAVPLPGRGQEPEDAADAVGRGHGRHVIVPGLGGEAYTDL